MSAMIRKAAIAFLLSASMATPAVANDMVSVDQQSSYTFTRVVQHNGRTKTKTRMLNERSYERMSARIELMPAASYRIGGKIAACRAPRGAANTASIAQDGADNVVFASQAGSGDAVYISQSGEGNIIAARQLGSNQTATASQSGDHNIVLIVQHCR